MNNFRQIIKVNVPVARNEETWACFDSSSLNFNFRAFENMKASSFQLLLNSIKLSF